MQGWSDIDVHSEAEKLQGKELQAFELRMKAYEIENATEQQPEPEPQPEPDEKKTAKRTITPKKKKWLKSKKNSLKSRNP